MSDICVFDIERRKSKHEDWAGKDERNSYPVPIDRLRFLIEIKQREQSDLWNELEQRDSKKIQIIRTSFAVFSLFVTGLIALFTLVQEPKELILTKEFTLLFSLVLVGMGLINYSLIKYIIAFKHSRLLFIRQINCIRHAKEAYAYALIEGKYPLSTEDLYFEEGKNIEEQSAYYRTFGRHRKLPIDNEGFREYHRKIFESPDNFTIFTLTILTTAIAALPIVYLWITNESNIIGSISTIFVLVFLGFVGWVTYSAKKSIDRALETDKTPSNKTSNTNSGDAKKRRT